jgi:K+-sensing histidine kinase KdpD
MKGSTLTVIYIEQNQVDFDLLSLQLTKNRNSEICLLHCSTTQKALELLEEQGCDLVLLDLGKYASKSLLHIQRLQRYHLSLPIVVVTGDPDLDLALDALNKGATDVLVKGQFTTDTLVWACRFALHRQQLQFQRESKVGDVAALNKEMLSINMELKETNTELNRQRNFVQEKNKQIQLLVNLLVHNLKQPIAAINSLSNILLEKKNSLNLQQKKLIDQIQYSASSMLDNILAMLNTHSLVNDDVSVTLEEENPFYTLNSAIDRFIVDATLKGIIIELRYTSHLPITQFDRRLLDYTLSNLLSFTINHHPGNNRIVISTQHEANHLFVNILVNELNVTEEDLHEASDTCNLSNDVMSEEDRLFSGKTIAPAYLLLQAMGGKLNATVDGKRVIFSFGLKLAKNQFVLSQN